MTATTCVGYRLPRRWVHHVPFNMLGSEDGKVGGGNGDEDGAIVASVWARLARVSERRNERATTTRGDGQALSSSTDLWTSRYLACDVVVANLKWVAIIVAFTGPSHDQSARIRTSSHVS
jgi:hypothetical protein